ncbi:MAG: hypothetical protein RDU30_00990 [Desulfovibrionaceae bacterium]|nr:hypothetical protein [Desulfovibrionaceae bacterium]
MNQSLAPRILIPLSLVLALSVLVGCNKTVRGPGMDNVAYTKSHTIIRADADPAARTVASAGPNVRVTVLETKNAFSRVSIDDGRVTGWIPAANLSDVPVKERAAATSAPKAAPGTSRSAPPAAKDSPVVAPSQAPETAAQTAEPTAEPTAAPAQTAEPNTAPAPTQDSSGGFLSPRAAQAAPPPAEPAKASPAPPPPARGKQASPDAFDPF